MLSISLLVVSLTRAALLLVSVWSAFQALRLAKFTFDPVTRLKCLFVALWSVLYAISVLVLIFSGAAAAVGIIQPILGIGMICIVGGWAWFANDSIHMRYTVEPLETFAERLAHMAEGDAEYFTSDTQESSEGAA